MQVTGASRNELYFMFGQLGFSVHITDDSEEILYGAPGVANWKGSVFVNRVVEDQLPGLNKRSIDDVPHRIRRQNRFRNAIVSSNPHTWNNGDDTYFGFATTSANFYRSNDVGHENYKTLYVASAPRANDLTGQVYIFNYEDGQGELDQKFKRFYTFDGHQMGESFGYSLITEDFNGDGLVDIAIGAPFYKTTQFDDGRVYVYLNLGDLRFQDPPTVLEGTYNSDEVNHAQFGMTMAKIGDINRDGYGGE